MLEARSGGEREEQGGSSCCCFAPCCGASRRRHAFAAGFTRTSHLFSVLTITRTKCVCWQCYLGVRVCLPLHRSLRPSVFSVFLFVAPGFCMSLFSVDFILTVYQIILQCSPQTPRAPCRFFSRRLFPFYPFSPWPTHNCLALRFPAV